MELQKIAFVKVGERDFPITLSNRAIISIENECPGIDSSMERLLKMFYFTAQAGAKKTGREFYYSWEEWLDLTEFYSDEILDKFPAALESIQYKKKVMEGDQDQKN